MSSSIYKIAIALLLVSGLVTVCSSCKTIRCKADSKRELGGKQVIDSSSSYSHFRSDPVEEEVTFSPAPEFEAAETVPPEAAVAEIESNPEKEAPLLKVNPSLKRYEAPATNSPVLVPVNERRETNRSANNLVVQQPKMRRSTVSPEPERVIDPPFPVQTNKPQMAAAPDKIDLSKPIVIEEDQKSQVIAAEGRDVVLDGDDRVIVISGGCGRLKLTGDRNQVQCDTAERIQVIGDDNMLVFGVMGDGAIRGDGNVITWGAGIDGLEPIVTTVGEGNAIERLE